MLPRRNPPKATPLAGPAAPARAGSQAQLLAHDMNNAIFPIRARLNALEAMMSSTAARGHLRALKRSLSELQKMSDSLSGSSIEPATQRPTGDQSAAVELPSVRQPTAILAILSARRANLVNQILLGAGITVKSVRASAGACDLWITQPSTAALRQARRRFKARASTAIILLGAASDAARAQWEALGAITVNDADDFKLIRSALGQVQQRWAGPRGNAR